MEYYALVLAPWVTGTFWVTLAVLAFALLFGGRIVRPVTALLDQRAATVRAALDEAAKLKAEAEAMLADAKKRQAQAAADAAQILATAHAEAARMAEALHQEAEATAKRRQRMAMERIAAAEKAAVQDVRNIAIEIAGAAATQMLRQGYAADATAALTDRAIAAVPQALHRPV